MLHLLLLNCAVLPLLLIFCNKHHDDRTPTNKVEQGERNEELRKDESKRFDNMKNEEQTNRRIEKDHQKKEEGKKANVENQKGEIKGNEGGNTKIYPPNPDYMKLAYEGWTEAEIQAEHESYVLWCENERAMNLRYAEKSRKREDRKRRRIEGEIVESSTQHGDEEEKDNESENGKWMKLKPNKTKTDKTQKSEKS